MESRIVPLFPLPDLMLFPGQVLPLHVFEQRYRQMTRDLLDGSGELVLGTVLGEDKQSLAGVASVQPVAGLGRLEKYEKLPDGRYLLVVLGISRVWVEPIEG
ncbi:MAG: LON peptidase substrate-binding domain-containing protein, partial [Pirellulaceae bacterium]|nr:LON peptidase substrate-binding domain-containing protein [Pirellulaceae bacterium]